jgi:hypothetical protein
MISTAVETHKGFRVQSRVEITENENIITRDQERMNVEKPYGTAQKLRLMVGTFTHWVHVTSVRVLQAKIISYVEVKFCMCVIAQKLFLGSVFMVMSGDFISSHCIAPSLPVKFICIDNIAYGLYQRPCGLTRKSEAACLLGSGVRISLRVWTFASCFWCVV